MKLFYCALLLHSITGLLMINAKDFGNKSDVEAPATTISSENVSTEVPVMVESTSKKAMTTTTTDEPNSHESSEEITGENAAENHPNIIEQPQQKRKLLYINQQQSGKFNVHLELNDVSLIVIPNKKDPQLSLLNLLLRSAQKSNAKKGDEKQFQANKTEDENVKLENVVHKNPDEYSKYKIDNSYVHATTTSNEQYPPVESRAPYHVDISSTLSQPSPVEIIPNANLMARSPVVKLMKPLPVAMPHRLFKRSIDTRFYGLNFDSPVLSDINISSSEDDIEEKLTESIVNSLEKDGNGEINTDGSEFVLLGAVENCGPGRRRNSYQICVAAE
jgi:hypothetical protein